MKHQTINTNYFFILKMCFLFFYKLNFTLEILSLNKRKNELCNHMQWEMSIHIFISVNERIIINLHPIGIYILHFVLPILFVLFL